MEIFSQNPLNTTKHLNFLDFKRAYLIYTNKDSSRGELKEIVANIKSQMNVNRTDYALGKDHVIKVTYNWLLGFIEGEGSFSYSPEKNTFTFIIVQRDNLPLMNAIKDFLSSKLEVDYPNQDTVKDDDAPVTVYSKKADSKGHIVNSIVVRRLNYIRTVLIPWLDTLSWQSKKVKDYQDWKALISIIDLGLHYTDEGKKIISRILAQMNNNRLSTINNWTEEDRTLLLTDIALLINKGSNYMILDGKTYIKSLNRFLSTNKKVAVQLIAGDTGVILKTFDSVSECAKFLDINLQTAHYRTKKNSNFYCSSFNQTVYIRKIED